MAKGSIQDAETVKVERKNANNKQKEGVIKNGKAIKRTNTKKTPLFKKYKVRIEAHRGACRKAYQNTIPAYQIAIDQDVDGIELDVWLTKDRVPIIVHGHSDAGLIEYGGLNKLVGDVDYEEIKPITLPDGTPIPTFEEVMTFFKNNEKPVSINIELKGEDEEVVEKVVDVVDRLGMWEVINMSSFTHRFRSKLEETLKAKKIKRHVTFGFLGNGKRGYPEFDKIIIKKNDMFTVDAAEFLKDAKDIQGPIATARKLGLRLGFYFPFVFDETEAVYSKLVDAGADCIITNEPDKLADFFEKQLASTKTSSN